MEINGKSGFAVLLVHKESSLTVGFTETFRNAVHHPLVSHSGEMAINLIEELKEIALVFVAIDLPDLSGFETVSRIRAKRQALPIVLLTNHLTVETMKVAMVCGCNEVLQEPVSRKMLQSILQKYLLNTSYKN